MLLLLLHDHPQGQEAGLGTAGSLSPDLATVAAAAAPLPPASPPSPGRRRGHAPHPSHAPRTMAYVYLRTRTVLLGGTTLS
jgi:hypothetical protein